MNWLVIGIGTVLSALFYWAGGRGRDFSKGFFFKSIVRDAGCSIVFAVLFTFLLPIDTKTVISILLSTAGLFGALSTYFKPLFGGKYGQTPGWPNYLVHGAFIGISGLPLLFAGASPLWLCLRVPLLAGLMGGCGLIKNVHIAEALRGASIILTLGVLI